MENCFFLLIKNANGYSEESNGNKYLTLVPTDKSKDKLKNYELKILLDQQIITQMIMMKIYENQIQFI